MLHILLLIIITFHIFVLSRLIFFPYPELFIYSYLTSKGLLPYKQIFDQHFPGVMFFPLNLYSVGIDTVFDYRVLHFAVVAITSLLIYLISKKIFKSSIRTLLPNVLYLLFQPLMEGYVLWIDTIIVIPILLAFYNFEIKSRNRMFICGFFMGIALLFKQVIIPLILLIYLYFIFRRINIKYLVGFTFGLLIPVIILLIWVLKTGILKDFVYWTGTYNLTIFNKMGRKPIGFNELVIISPIYITTLISIFFLIKKRIPHIIHLSLFLLGCLVFAYARFDYVHLVPSLPFACIIISLFLLNFFKEKKKRYAFVGIFLGMILIYNFKFLKPLVGSEIKFFGLFEYNLKDKVNMYTDTDDKIFALGTTPHLYYLADRLPAGNQFVFQFPWFMVEAQDKILNGLILDPPKLVIKDDNSTVSGLNLVKFMQDIDNFIKTNYYKIETVNGIDILIKNI